MDSWVLLHMGMCLWVIEAPCASHWEPHLGWWISQVLCGVWFMLLPRSCTYQLLDRARPHSAKQSCTSSVWPLLCATTTWHRGDGKLCRMLALQTVPPIPPALPVKRLITKSETCRSLVSYCWVSWITDTGTSLPPLFSVTMKNKP